MGKTPAKTEIDSIIDQSLSRDDVEELVDKVYASFPNVDHVHRRIRELEEDIESASGSEKNELTEKRGILLYLLGRYQEARENLEAAGDRKEAHHFLGRSLLELGKAEEAVEYLEAGRSGDDDFETDMLLAHARCRMGEEDAAEELCDAHEDTHGDSPDMLCCRGKIAEARGEYGRAVELYEQCLEKDPEHREALFRLAHNRDMNGEDDEAVELYQRCTTTQPTCIGALLNLGILYEDRREYKKARDCYRRVLAIDPTHKQAQLYLKDAESAMEEEVMEDERTRQSRRQRAMQTPVGEFQLSERAQKCLDKLGVNTLGDLTTITERQLKATRNVGDETIQEIKELMARNDLALGEAAGLAGAQNQLNGSQIDPEKLNLPIDYLSLSTRSRRCMDNLGISTVGELIGYTADELLETPNFGDKSVEEIKQKLSTLGLELRKE